MGNKTSPLERHFTRITGAGGCIDGRPSGLFPREGIKTPGGMLSYAVVRIVMTGEELTAQIVEDTARDLKQAGHKPGVHEGDRHNEADSGCGAADNLAAIISLAGEEFDLIHGRIRVLPRFDQAEKDRTVRELEAIANYDPRKIGLSGPEIIAAAKKGGAKVDHYEGSHTEERALINMHPYSTLSIDQANKHGMPAFNFDLLAAGLVSREHTPDKKSHSSLILAFYLLTLEALGAGGLPIEVVNYRNQEYYDDLLEDSNN